MAKYYVHCTEHDPNHERIIAIGCSQSTTGAADVRFSEEQAIQRIESDADTFVVRNSHGVEGLVEVEERHGRKFLITKPDHTKTDNLGALPACASKPAPPPRPYRPTPVAGSHSNCTPTNWKK